MAKLTSESTEIRVLRDQVRLYKKQNEVLLQLLDASNQEKQHLYQEQLLSQEREKRSLAREQQNQQRIMQLEGHLQSPKIEEFLIPVLSPRTNDEKRLQMALTSLLEEEKQALPKEPPSFSISDPATDEPVAALDFLAGDLEFQQLFDAAVNGNLEESEFSEGDDRTAVLIPVVSSEVAVLEIASPLPDSEDDSNDEWFQIDDPNDPLNVMDSEALEDVGERI